MNKIYNIGDWRPGAAPFCDGAKNYTMGVLVDNKYGPTYRHYWIYTDECILPVEARPETLERSIY